MKTIIGNLPAGPKTAMPHRMRSWLAAALLLMASTALCEAHSVLVTAQNLWSNEVIYTVEMNTVADSGCEKQIVGAAPIIQVKDPSTGSLVTYEFLFWDINAKPYTSQEVNFQPMCGVPNTAIAVYWPTGGCAGCPPPTTDSVLAYSLNDAKIIPTTPIGSATGGWTPGSTVVTPPTTITALPQIIGYGNFKDWDVLGLGSTLSSSSSLSVTEAGEVVLAFYGIPDPDPCASLRNEYAVEFESCVGDGVSVKACQALVHGLALQVEKCEATNGEKQEL
jgi:hypothetical protein